MRLLKPVILLLVCLIFGVDALAQRAKNTSRNRKNHNYRNPVVRGNKAKIICPVFENSKYPYHGVGFKLGDPFGVTYKYYHNKKLAVALDFGKAASGLYSDYYRKKFDEYSAENDTLSENASVSYASHTVRTDWVGEVKVLYHFKAEKISPGLQVYMGGGWEWKSTKLSYSYYYNEQSDGGADLKNEFRITDLSRFTMGPQIVLGIEYSYFQLPISAFMEVEFFTDVLADPGWQRFEGGVGLRYIF